MVGPSLGQSLSHKGDHIEIVWFSKTSVSCYETVAFEVQGSQNRSIITEKLDRRKRCDLVSFFLHFWLVRGAIVGPQIDNKTISKSIKFQSQFREVFWALERVGWRQRRSSWNAKRRYINDSNDICI